MRHLEDFKEGQVFELGEETISEQEILDFARRFDAQPFHVDREAAKASIYGGLIASGWHTASFFMGLLVRALLHEVASLGASGIDELRWLKPVRPGDTLRARLSVVGTRPSTKHAVRAHHLRRRDVQPARRARAADPVVGDDRPPSLNRQPRIPRQAFLRRACSVAGGAMPGRKHVEDLRGASRLAVEAT